MRRCPCKEVRDIWHTERPTQRLLDSLLTDYATRGDGNGRGLASVFQTNAATRLLYYYPNRTAPLIVARLKRLDIRPGIIGSESWTQRTAANEVETAALVKAVAWSEDPRVAAEIDRIIATTKDTGLLAACVEGTNDNDTELFIKRCKNYFDRLHEAEFDSNALDDDVLRRIAHRAGDRAKPLLTAYAKKADLGRLSMFCVALRAGPPELAIELLAPHLDDKRDYLLGMRVCDLAAQAICMNDPELTFRFDRGSMDKQIADIKKRLAAKSRPSPQKDGGAPPKP